MFCYSLQNESLLPSYRKENAHFFSLKIFQYVEAIYIHERYLQSPFARCLERQL